jgi:hypothetical protein
MEPINPLLVAMTRILLCRGGAAGLFAETFATALFAVSGAIIQTIECPARILHV